ncbi:MAG: ftsL [Gammaproteobacteria bacterium]|jgi:cell division protein FtsL|nr:ftsL [Gammaproteobacteria bacterium]MCE3238939.1 ftsL [Gammaproteobacteria bacterium]
MNAAARLYNQGVLSRGWVVSVFWAHLEFPLFALIFSVLFSALSLIYMTNSVRGLNARIQQSLVEHDQLRIQQGQLLLEKSTLMMQAHIQNMAEKNLDMVVPEAKAVIMVDGQ